MVHTQLFMNMVVCIMIGYGSGCCGLVLLRTSVEGSSGCIGPRAQGPSHMLGFSMCSRWEDIGRDEWEPGRNVPALGRGGVTGSRSLNAAGMQIIGNLIKNVVDCHQTWLKLFRRGLPVVPRPLLRNHGIMSQ